jgi:3-oxoacyl-[acyl-carrier-protein] synthase II
VKVDIQGIGWVTRAGIGNGCPGETFELGAGALPALQSRMFLEVTHPRFGRFDSYAKAGFGAIALALRGAGLDRWTHKRAIGLVVGTRCGCLEADRAYFATAAFAGGALASPNRFAYTLPGTMLGEASIQFGLTGPSFVVDDAPGHLAGVQAALDLLQWGFCETVVAGWCAGDAQRLRTGPAGPSGAVFFVLARGGAAALWQWNGRDLRRGGQRAADLVGLAHQVLADRRDRPAEGRGSSKGSERCE